MTMIKICGLRRIEDVMAVNETLPDFAGFVFAESRRQVDEQTAEFLKARLNPSVKAVGVFVNERIERIVRLCRSGVIDFVQLHGDEDGNYIKTLKKLVPNPVIRAVRVRSTGDIKKAASIDCDYLLLDAWDDRHYGGTGRTFDWSVIPGMTKPFFLAGGINPENVVKALELVNPYAVDVSSGAETDGCKDPDKLRRIVELVRKYRPI